MKIQKEAYIPTGRHTGRESEKQREKDEETDSPARQKDRYREKQKIAERHTATFRAATSTHLEPTSSGGVGT